MGWKEFTAAIVGDVLSWPVMVLVVVLIFVRPIRALIGRVKAAKGFGGELEFSDLLESAEENVEEVIEAEASDTGEHGVTAASASSTGQPAVEGDPSGPDPARDPSGAIITSWQRLLDSLDRLTRANAGKGRPARNPKVIIAQLARNHVVSEAFYRSALDLLELRNQVAHGEATPTQGAARTYVERAGQLTAIANGMMVVHDMDTDQRLTN